MILNNMPNTKEELRMLLGIQPLEAEVSTTKEDYPTAKPHNSDGYYHLLIDVVAAAQTQVVEIVGNPFMRATDFVNVARTTCRKLGISPENVQPELDTNSQNIKFFTSEYC